MELKEDRTGAELAIGELQERISCHQKLVETVGSIIAH
jgi:hypothetical protein